MIRGNLAAQQCSLLLRHFLRRFFDSELVPRHADARVTLIQILALMSVPGLVVMIFLLRKYARLSALSPEAAHLAALDEKCLFLYFSMVVVGLIAVLEWDTLFPDRRDYLILMSLPVKASTLFLSKAGSLCIFLLLFSMFVNAVPMILYPLFFSRALPQAGWFMFSHGMSVLTSNAFVFFACISLQGFLLNILGPRLFLRVSRLMQLLLLVLLLSIFTLMPAVSFESLRRNPVFLGCFPPAWFLGLYQTLLVGKTPEFSVLAVQAVTALVLAGMGFVLSYVVAYKRQIRKTLELGHAGSTAHSGIRRFLADGLHLLFLRNPTERASFCFIIKTITRSQAHRTYLGASLGAGMAFVVMGLVTVITRQGFGAFHSFRTELLSVPLVLNYFLLLGMRGIFALPVTPAANWIFRMSGGRGVHDYLSGARKVMCLVGIILPICLFFPLFVSFWGWRTASLHTGFCTVLSLILIEILMTTLDHMPFTCPYTPGKANLKLWWWVYLLGFTNYAYSMTQLEQRLLRSPRLFVLFFLVSVVLLWAIARSRRRRIDKIFALRFDSAGLEAPEPLGLSYRPF